MTSWSKVAAWLEVAGGARPLPKELGGRLDVAFIIGIWWLVLIVVVVVFSGQNTKFLYVDF